MEVDPSKESLNMRKGYRVLKQGGNSLGKEVR